MSGFFDNVRSPGVIGVVLGLVVLLAFGGLSMAVFDPRLNGDAAAALKDEVSEQSLEIFSLEDEIERAEQTIVEQKRNQEVSKKLAVAEKTFDLLEEKRATLEKEIEKAKVEIVKYGEDQLAYRDEYRLYERQRAIGETFDEITLTNGKVLKKAEIKELQTNKVRFTTEYGSSTATWDELPQSWRDRFQIGEGELEVAQAKLDEARKKRNEAAAVVRASRSKDLREMELKKSLSRITQAISSKKVEVESARAKVAILRGKARDYRNKASEARARGNTSSHSNSAQKAEASAEKLNAGLRITEDRIRALEKERSQVESDLRRLERE